VRSELEVVVFVGRKRRKASWRRKEGFRLVPLCLLSASTKRDGATDLGHTTHYAGGQPCLAFD
jgi:hypothetical protein